MIALGRGNIAKKFINDGFNGHVAEVWERLCQLAVSGSNIEGHTWGEASRWWGKVPIFEEGKRTLSATRNLNSMLLQKTSLTRTQYL